MPKEPVRTSWMQRPKQPLLPKNVLNIALLQIPFATGERDFFFMQQIKNRSMTIA